LKIKWRSVLFFNFWQELNIIEELFGAFDKNQSATLDARELQILFQVCVLQCAELCVAVCCSMLQCAAFCCSVSQSVSGRWIGCACVAVCGSVLQCAAVCCSVFQDGKLDMRERHILR